MNKYLKKITMSLSYFGWAIRMYSFKSFYNLKCFLRKYSSEQVLVTFWNLCVGKPSSIENEDETCNINAILGRATFKD